MKVTESEKENVLSRRLNKILETRLENDQVFYILKFVITNSFYKKKLLGDFGSIETTFNILHRKHFTSSSKST